MAIERTVFLKENVSEGSRLEKRGELEQRSVRIAQPVTVYWPSHIKAPTGLHGPRGSWVLDSGMHVLLH